MGWVVDDRDSVVAVGETGIGLAGDSMGAEGDPTQLEREIRRIKGATIGLFRSDISLSLLSKYLNY